MPEEPTEGPSRERAERIARAHACVTCAEYSWRRVTVRPPLPAQREALGIVWMATLVCGVCRTEQVVGIDPEGDIAFVS